MTNRSMAALAAVPTAPPLEGSLTSAPSVMPDLLEFRPETHSLPTFFVWTLGCQMNQSDSEEMAGQLLAAGCGRARSMEDADLVVINTCAVREHAEAKVIGRQGLLADLKRSRPGMRVVLTGCGVREAERSGLARPHHQRRLVGKPRLSRRARHQHPDRRRPGRAVWRRGVS